MTQVREMNNLSYKIQALNCFNMYFDQIISVFRARYETQGNINLDQLSEISGLNRRKARLILNFLADVGLSQKRTLGVTNLGSVVYKYDGYLQNEGTLWLLHYLQATNEYLIIWNRVINRFSQTEKVKRVEFRTFRGFERHVSEYTYKHHIGKEIRIILDAYSNQRFSKLNLLESMDDSYQIHRNNDVPNLIILCAIVLFRNQYYKGATSIDIEELCNGYNSPGRIFILDNYMMRHKIEELKNLGAISIESRGDLNQVRLKEDVSIDGILERYYQL